MVTASPAAARGGRNARQRDGAPRKGSRPRRQSERAMRHTISGGEQPYRRLLQSEPELPTLAQMVQSVDVGQRHGPVRETLGGSGDSYVRHSLDTVRGEIDGLLALGIDRVFLQMKPDFECDHNGAAQ